MKIKRRTLALLIRRSIQVASVSLVIGLYFFYFHTSFFTITSYEITGTDEESRMAINEKLQELRNQKMFVIFPLDKIFTYDEDLITKIIVDTIPETATVQTRPSGLHTVKVLVTQLKPMFRISNSEAVSADGFIFSTKYKITQYPKITIASSTVVVVKKGGIIFSQLQSGDIDANKNFLKDLSLIVAKVSSIIFPVAAVTIESTGDVLCFNASGTSKVIFLKDTDKKKVWSTLVSAIDTDPLKTKLEKNKEGLEYLDVRYGNKVFYRFNDMTFQNGSVNGILENHATTTQEATSSLPQ